MFLLKIKILNIIMSKLIDDLSIFSDLSSFSDVSSFTDYDEKNNIANLTNKNEPDIVSSASISEQSTIISHTSSQKSHNNSLQNTYTSSQKSHNNSLQNTHNSLQNTHNSLQNTQNNSLQNTHISQKSHSSQKSHISQKSHSSSQKSYSSQKSHSTSQKSYSSQKNHSTLQKNDPLNDNTILNKIYIDIAVLCEEYTNIGVICGDHILNLDEIDIPEHIFQLIFYPYKENFGLNKDFLNNNKQLLEYISFLPEFRIINNKKFYLLEEIITNIENDLSISRNCFTKESLVELTNEIIDIKSILDIKCCSLLSSLTWENVLEIINNYEKIKCNEIIPILVVNIVFKTPTQGVKDTIIRFQYKLTK